MQKFKVQQVRNGKVIATRDATADTVSTERALLKSGMRGKIAASSDTIRVTKA